MMGSGKNINDFEIDDVINAFKNSMANDIVLYKDIEIQIAEKRGAIEVLKSIKNNDKKLINLLNSGG